jgi:hypothetical protein
MKNIDEAEQGVGMRSLTVDFRYVKGEKCP